MLRARWIECLLAILLVSGTFAVAEAPAYANPQILIEPADLAKILHDPDVRVLDVGTTADYWQGHIPGALNLPARETDDLDANRQGFPVEPWYAQAVFRDLGINNNSRVFIYDDEHSDFAARVFYVLEFFGLEHVQVLDGGYKHWVQAGFATTRAPSAIRAGNFTADPTPAIIATSEWVDKHLKDPAVRLVDTRTAAEFSGEMVEGPRGGHIPGAVNIDWTRTLAPGDLKTILDLAALKKLFAEYNVLPSQEVVTYCQTGMRASEVYFALRLLGYQRVRVYDGSWQDWSANPKMPVVK